MGKTDDLFLDILRRRPSLETILLILQKMKKEGRKDDLIRECRKALDLYPNDIRLRRLLVEAYQEADLPEEAGSELKRISSILEDLSLVYRSQAEILARKHMDEQAREMMQIYLAHHPGDQKAVDFLNRTGADKGHAEADISSPIEETRPETGRAIFTEVATPTLAELYYKQGKIEDAVHIYERVISTNPGDSSSKKRLDELRAMISPDKDTGTGDRDRLIAKRGKENVIKILEGWLERVREMRYA